MMSTPATAIATAAAASPIVKSGSNASLSVASAPDDTPTKNKVPQEHRMLIKVLEGKGDMIKLDTFGEKIMFSNAKEIAKVVTELFESPHKIQATVVSVYSTDIIKTLEKNCNYDPDEPNFDETVKTLNDVHVSFLWGVLRKHFKGELTDKIIELWMGKSQKPFKNFFTYLTGNTHNYGS